MHDALRRSLLLAALFGASFVLLYFLKANDQEYNLFDLLQGEAPPRHLPEEFTLPTTSALSEESIPALLRLDQEFQEVVASVVPSVVSVVTRQTFLEQGVQRSPFGLQPYQRQNNRQGLGSGVIVSQEGHIITNDHVIRDQDEIKVILHDGNDYDAILVGSDPELDVAVLRIQSSRSNFPALRRGDSDEVQSGQIVFAVGNPFGLRETVTQGIVSAKNRQFGQSDTAPNYIQTDTAINPGNSGGPLVNLRGDVIGINVAVYSTDSSRTYQGIGLSIPSNDAWDAFEQIATKGRVVKGYLGIVVYDEKTPYLLSQFNELDYPHEYGAMVASIQPGSPAERCGLMRKDVILSVDGDRVETNAQSISSFMETIQTADVGQTIPLEVWRNGKTLLLEPLIADRAFFPEMSAEPVQLTLQSLTPEEVPTKFGVTVEPLPAEAQERGVQGLRVSKILPGSPASTKLRRNDIIIGINQTAVFEPADFYQVIADQMLSQRSRILLVRRENGVAKRGYVEFAPLR
ncbi:MAG: trypsin-like peptidase domain-containing protein [Verrucomicrobiota bacterium]